MSEPDDEIEREFLAQLARRLKMPDFSEESLARRLGFDRLRLEEMEAAFEGRDRRERREGQDVTVTQETSAPQAILKSLARRSTRRKPE